MAGNVIYLRGERFHLNGIGALGNAVVFSESALTALAALASGATLPAAGKRCHSQRDRGEAGENYE